MTNASRELKEAHLLDLFEITEVDISDEELDDFGEIDYVLYRIETELSTQYNTRKQLVLKTMYAYLNQRGTIEEVEYLSLFGTNSFHLVWEDVCADIMNNMLNVPLKDLPFDLKPGYDEEQKLIELIEKPMWTATGLTADDTLIPDFITIQNEYFVIFDAKYYNAILEYGIKPKGQPGIESITKQYLYQLAFQKFIEAHGFTEVKNCFILPTENKTIECKGEARLNMLEALGLQSIKVRMLPAEIAFDYYLSGKKINIYDLSL